MTGPLKKLEAAIEEYLTTQGDPRGLLVDWVLVTAEHIDWGDGNTSTTYGVFGPAMQPIHQRVGLLRFATKKADDHIVE